MKNLLGQWKKGNENQWPVWPRSNSRPGPGDLLKAQAKFRIRFGMWHNNAVTQGEKRWKKGRCKEDEWWSKKMQKDFWSPTSESTQQLKSMISLDCLWTCLNAKRVGFLRNIFNIMNPKHVQTRFVAPWWGRFSLHQGITMESSKICQSPAWDTNSWANIVLWIVRKWRIQRLIIQFIQ